MRLPERLRFQLTDIDAKVLNILEACLELDEPSRAAFVADQCDSPELAAKVRRLLEISQTGLPPTELIADHTPMDEPLPERIGKFRVMETIGRGGMGTVVRAERTDGLFSQTVAIKLLRSDLLGESARLHFENERRLLARLDHLSIARILDGGEEAGRPYLVMEYVEGRLLLDDLNQRKAAPAARLEAFLQVADAVSYAHRRLVIHADLKPGNVFRSAEGQVKLLDFGIGRLLGEYREGEGEAAAHPLTRAYAPPERLAGEAPSIAGDVFGLGRLLGEMLTPPDGAARRSNEDLQAIVAKAMATDPAERYPDAASLAADVRRHMAAKPVLARKGGWRYLAGRFVRRNRLAVAVAATFVLIVLAAAAVSLTLYVDAKRQREAAEARFEEVRSLAKFQLLTLYPQLAALPGTLEARARLSEEAQLYLDRLSALPQAPDAVRLETAIGYNRLAEIQGVPNRPNLGRAEAAAANLARAEAILAPMLAARPGDKVLARGLAWTRLFQADLAIWQAGKAAEGDRLLALAEPLVAQAREERPAWRELESFRRTVRLDVLGWSERYAAESDFAAETLAWLATLPPSERDRPLYVIAEAEARNAHGEGLFYRQRAKEALADARAADALIRTALERHPDHPALLSARVVSLYNLITTLEPFGMRRGLLPMAEELSRIGRRSRAFEPKDRLITWRARNAEALLAQLLGAAGRHGDAIRIQTGIVLLDRERLAAAPGDTRTSRDLGFSTQLLGTLQWESGDRGGACQNWEKADALFTRLERLGTLNDWDRTHVVAPMRHNHRICTNDLPASAYRRPA